MRKLALLAAVAFAVTTPAYGAVLNPGATGVTPDPFDSSTRGTLLASFTTSGNSPAATFSADFTTAVYLNTLGTLDFYYQVLRTGAGTSGNEAIQSFTASSFMGFSVDAFLDATDFDGAGGFVALNNSGTDSSTAFRRIAGDVLGIDFGANPLTGTENSETYIFRTDATNYTLGTYGIIDGSTVRGEAFVPTAAVPEPGTWMMMLAGFGGIGMALRFRRRRKVVLPQLA